MKFGFVIPWADADEVGELAAVAEESGWDGVVRLGAGVGRRQLGEPRPRRRPHLEDPARHDAHPAVAAAPVGAGQPGRHRRSPQRRPGHAVGRARRRSTPASTAFGEECDKRDARRADGRVPRHRVRAVGGPAVRVLTASTTRCGRPSSRRSGTRSRRPRVPIWCVGALGHPKSMRRALALGRPHPAGDRRRHGARQANLDEVAAIRDQLPGRRLRRHRRGRLVRALPGRVGRGRRDLVDRDAVGRRRTGPTGARHRSIVCATARRISDRGRIARYRRPA